LNLKNIHIGQIIQSKVKDQAVKTARLTKYFDCDEEEINKMYQAESIDTNLLLGWSKLLKTDFFRFYVGHLTMYHAIKVNAGNKKIERQVGEFRKNVYSKEIIDFILQQMKDKNLSISQVMTKYNIPKTTIHRWVRKQKAEGSFQIAE
jgi:hypothetical protein